MRADGGIRGDVEVPDYREIRVNPADGRIFSCVDFRRPFVAPPTPTVDREAAIKLALAKIDEPSAAAESAALRVTLDLVGNQLLMWEIGVQETVSQGGQNVTIHTLVSVNALDGSVEIAGGS